MGSINITQLEAWNNSRRIAGIVSNLYKQLEEYNENVPTVDHNVEVKYNGEVKAFSNAYDAAVLENEYWPFVDAHEMIILAYGVNKGRKHDSMTDILSGIVYTKMIHSDIVDVENVNPNTQGEQSESEHESNDPQKKLHITDGDGEIAIDGYTVIEDGDKSVIIGDSSGKVPIGVATQDDVDIATLLLAYYNDRIFDSPRVVYTEYNNYTFPSITDVMTKVKNIKKAGEAKRVAELADWLAKNRLGESEQQKYRPMGMST